MNPVYVRLMARRAVARVPCPVCLGKKGQAWKENSNWTWRDCFKCKGKGSVPVEASNEPT